MIIKKIFRPMGFFANFILAKKNPLKVQEKILIKILKRNKETEYGKKYNFAKIKTIEDFQKKIPIVKYPDISFYAEKMKNGENNILVKDKVIFFATSSGTTSESKFIPITKKRMDFHRGEFLLWMRYMLKDNIKIVKGKTLYFAGGSLNGYTKGKIPHGNISGYLTENSSKFVKKKLVLDMDTLNILDFNKKMEKAAVKSLLEKNISQIAFASAVQAILFFDYLVENKDILIKKVEKKNKKRAKFLSEIKDFKPINFWPKLWLINCIKAGVNSTYLEVVKEKLGKKDVVIRDPGVLASEGRLTLGISDMDQTGIIPLNETFFEFAEKIGDDFLPPVTVDKVKNGCQYKIIMTTQEGLYRYDIEDVLEIVSFMEGIPIARFVSRNKFLNITEEHAPEAEIIRGVKDALVKLKIKFRSFTVIPYIEKESRPRYELLVEFLDKVSDQKCKKIIKLVDENWQKYMLTYAETRNEFGRMDFPILSIVKKGTYDKIDSEILAKRGQAKPINVTENLLYRNNFEIEKTFKF